MLFILVDDLGWSDVSYNGSRVYETPHVDRLARQGMVLTDFYSAGPVCSPTRASIMTGKSPARLGLTTWLYTPEKDPPFVTHHLPLEEFTIAEAFERSGYATGYFGKWHLGYKANTGPRIRASRRRRAGLIRRTHGSWRGRIANRRCRRSTRDSSVRIT